MKLFKLHVKPDIPNNLGFLWYTECTEMLIYANTEGHARILAMEKAANETPIVWDREEYSSCVEIVLADKAFVLMTQCGTG